MLRFAKYAVKELIVSATLSGAAMVAAFWAAFTFIPNVFLALLAGLPFLVLFVLVVSFFRDPKRVVPRGEHRLVAPADGMVFDIGEVDENEFLGEKALRIGIFLSLFDCHINRMPCSGTVEKIVYRKGKFHSAWTRANECSAENESNFIGISNAASRGIKVAVKQIAGMIARRIVCEVREGDKVERGQAFGMIKFGSRVELYIPASTHFTLKVKLRTHLRAGRTVIAALEDGPEETPPGEAGAEEKQEEPERIEEEAGAETGTPTGAEDEPATDGEEADVAEEEGHEA